MSVSKLVLPPDRLQVLVWPGLVANGLRSTLRTCTPQTRATVMLHGIGRGHRRLQSLVGKPMFFWYSAIGSLPRRFACRGKRCSSPSTMIHPRHTLPRSGGKLPLISHAFSHVRLTDHTPLHIFSRECDKACRHLLLRGVLRDHVSCMVASREAPRRVIHNQESIRVSRFVFQLARRTADD